jgi:methionyl-tRNA synthetase
LVDVREIEQFFDPVKAMFLPDRYIQGGCPKCGALDQYGDACEVCGAVYNATELVNPRSTLTGATPVLAKSDHYFFRLSDPRCVAYLRAWLSGASTQDRPPVQTEVANKVREWLGEEADAKLADWDISRDAPYFGIPIPDAPNKYFYVWLDAPIGYLAALKHHFDAGQAAQHWHAQSRTVQNFDAFMKDPQVEQVHFIGKDIVYFHTLFFPAMLHFSGRKSPSAINVHGFMTVSGEKMSKSRGTGLSPQRYLELGLNPEWLRYYLAAKLNARVEDVDFNPDDFLARVNSDLIGKYVNIASRAAGFLNKRFDGQVIATGTASNDSTRSLELIKGLRGSADSIAHAWDARDNGRAVREIMALADRVNQFADEVKPWELARNPDLANELQAVCSTLIEAFHILTVFLHPVLPATTEHALHFLNCHQQMTGGVLPWSACLQFNPEGGRIGAYEHLMTRVEAKQIDALFDTPPQAAPSTVAPTQAAHSATPAATSTTSALPTISIDQFNAVELRVARIVEAGRVEGSNRLLRLMLDVGEDRPRQVFSGIAQVYAPEQLINRLTVLVANLEPRKMKFGVSEGMVLAAGSDDPQNPGIYLLNADSGARPGMRVN